MCESQFKFVQTQSKKISINGYYRFRWNWDSIILTLSIHFWSYVRKSICTNGHFTLKCVHNLSTCKLPARIRTLCFAFWLCFNFIFISSTICAVCERTIYGTQHVVWHKTVKITHFFAAEIVSLHFWHSFFRSLDVYHGVFNLNIK